jgi:hypothetical protein
MSTSNTGNDFEHLDIAGTEQVKESYRAALQEEPRAIIDDAIRAAARRAVSSAPTSIGKTWFNRWTTPLAAAATVMLTSSVIFMAVRDRPEVAPPIAEMVAVSDKAKAVPSETAQNVGTSAPALESDVTDKRADAAAPAPANITQTLQLNQTKEKKSYTAEPTSAPAMARVQDSSNRVMQSPSAPSEVAASQQRIPPAPAKQTAPLAEMAKATPIAVPATPLIAAPKVMKEMKAEVASNLNAQDASRKKQSDSEATAALTAQATGKVVSPPPPAAVNVAGVAVAPAPPQTRMLAKPQLPEPVMPRVDASPAAPVVAAAPAPAPSPAADNMEKSLASPTRLITTAAEKSEKIESAEAWIKRMTELKRQEKNKELADEIVRFRKRYPSVELPKELVEAQN